LELRKWLTGEVLPVLRDQGRVAAGQPKRLQAKGEGRPVAVLDWQGEIWVPMGEALRLMREERRGRGWRRE
jgi:prophage antirepressor-like protein